MKKIENAIGLLFGLGFGAMALLAIFVLGTLIYKGPAPRPMAGFAAVATAPAATTTAATPPAASGAVDLAAGEKAFKACKACHKAEQGAKHGTGPALWGVVGAAVASREGFKYSEALQALAGQVWDAQTLDAYLTNPKTFAPGNRMAFAGVKDAADRQNLIAWLAQQSDTPVAIAAEAGVTQAAATSQPEATEPEAPAEPYADLPDDAVVEIDPVAWPEGVTYADPPARTDSEIAEIAAKLAALEATIPSLDYQGARYHPIHFSPMIDTASNEECLACHQEILANTVRDTSPAGVKAAETMAWYQTLDTYAQGQSDFHWRHMQSDFAKQVMNLECTFCHKGNDPREESPDMLPVRAPMTAPVSPEFTLRKMVNPSETCLLCHGAMPDPETIMGLSGPWHEARVDLEYAEAPNGCLSCHAESFRTNRHQVTYLKAASIEQAARAGTSDTCYGCHGGRAWYRIAYPYARTPWPGMDTETVPDWAMGRPAQSKAEYLLTPAQ
jgi:cytochrome c2